MSICANWPVAFTPLDDLGTGLYQGFQGGLYPGGVNRAPLAHDARGIAIADRILPLDGAGNVDTAHGKIVFILIGSSWTNLIAPHFESLVAAESDLLHPSLQVVNVGRGGKTIVHLASLTDSYWQSWIPGELSLAGLTLAQVQAAWFLQGERDPPGTFPARAQQTQVYWEAAIANARAVMPNLKSLWLSSPMYLGYAQPSLVVPEPAYGEQGFAVKWAIEKQIAGNLPPLPFTKWGFYPWANGGTVRGDGFAWNCPTDVLVDGIHPSVAGGDKIARRQFRLMLSDPCAKPWFGSVTGRDVGSPPPPTQSVG